MQEYTEQALALVKAQAGVRVMTPDEILDMTRNLAAKLQAIAEGADGKEEAAEFAYEPKKAIKLNSIICCECGKTCKMLTKQHLATHGLTPAEYREKCGYKPKQSLSCRALTKQRKDRMAGMRIWEKRTREDGATDEQIPAPADTPSKPKKRIQPKRWNEL
ncbi:MAG: MucR family transcriptional regulator [Proteobacteria bacterium]|nr:MucR family transcriptional regulator [Pseudomonadota bacterium]